MMLNRFLGFFGRMMRGGQPVKPPEKETKSVQSQTDPDKKWTDDKVLLTQELEDTKKYYEGELAKLKEKLKEAKGDASFEALRDKSAEMKMNYEAKIVGQEGRSAGDSKQEVVSEVKRIMSSVYHSLKSEFEDKSTYDGAAINSTIMDTVKSVTLQLIQSQEEESAKKQGPAAEISEIFLKEASPVTGDRGNPYYAAELEKRQKDGSFSISRTTSKTSAAVDNEPVDISKKVDALKNLVNKSESSNDKELDKGKSSKARPKVDTEPVDIVKKADVSLAHAATSEPIIAPVSVTMATPTGGRGNVRYGEELDNIEGGISMKFSMQPSSPVTGAQGNIYREEEILRKAKAQEIVSEVISAAVAPSTGGKGNPYYAAELNKAAEVSAASEQKSKESEKEKQKPEGKPKEKPQSKPAEARKPTEKPKPSNEGKPQEKPKPKPNEQPKSDKKPVDKVTKPAPESKKPEKDTKSSTEAKSDTKSVETKPDKDSKVQKDSGKTSEATSESVKKTDQKKSEPQKTESAKSEGKPTESAKPQSTSSTDKPKIPVRTLTDSDDDLRPKPPPLFDDDDESEDDDWLTPKIRK